MMAYGAVEDPLPGAAPAARRYPGARLIVAALVLTAFAIAFAAVSSVHSAEQSLDSSKLAFDGISLPQSEKNRQAAEAHRIGRLRKHIEHYKKQIGMPRNRKATKERLAAMQDELSALIAKSPHATTPHHVVAVESHDVAPAEKQQQAQAAVETESADEVTHHHGKAKHSQHWESSKSKKLKLAKEADEEEKEEKDDDDDDELTKPVKSHPKKETKAENPVENDVGDWIQGKAKKVEKKVEGGQDEPVAKENKASMHHGAVRENNAATKSATELKAHTTKAPSAVRENNAATKSATEIKAARLAAGGDAKPHTAVRENNAAAMSATEIKAEILALRAVAGGDAKPSGSALLPPASPEPSGSAPAHKSATQMKIERLAAHQSAGTADNSGKSATDLYLEQYAAEVRPHGKAGSLVLKQCLSDLKHCLFLPERERGRGSCWSGHDTREGGRACGEGRRRR